MTYQLERRAIQTYFAAQWGALSPSPPIGFNRHKFKPVEGGTSVRVTINRGEARQISFTRPGSNKIQMVGVVQFEIYTPGGVGSDLSEYYAEAIQNMFINKNLATDGTVATSAADVFVQFGRGGLMPYIAGAAEEPPFLRTTVNAPFVREADKA